jgi:hypothetical protein
MPDRRHLKEELAAKRSMCGFLLVHCHAACPRRIVHITFTFRNLPAQLPWQLHSCELSELTTIFTQGFKIVSGFLIK